MTIEDLQAVMSHIEQSTMGTESEDDFNALFEDLDLTFTKIGRTVKARNEVIVRILNHLDKIDFQLQDVDADGGFFGQELNRTTFNLTRMNMILHDVHYRKFDICQEDAPSRAQRLLCRNDILFQMVRPYQKNNYFVNFCDSNNVASTGYAQLRSKIEPMFLYYLIHTTFFVNKVLSRCTGTSYPAINSTDLEKIKFFIPSLPEQQKIANVLSSIEKVSTQIDASKEWKKGLLQRMFV